VQAFAAHSLVGVDLNFLSARTSDPYCAVTVGDCTKRTATRHRTLEPNWDGEEVMEFLVYHERQNVLLDVFDANVLKQDVRLATLKEPPTVAELVARCRQTKWLPLAGCAADADGATKEGSIQLRVDFTPLRPDDGTQAPFAKVLVLKLGHLRGAPPAEAAGCRLRLRFGELELLSRPCKAIDPGNVHGFGKRITSQIQKLSKKGVEPKVLAEVFELSEVAVAEVCRLQAHEDRTFFGWDEAHYALLPACPAGDVHLEILLPGRWKEWQPLATQPWDSALKLWRSTELTFETSAGQASLALSMELLCEN